MPSPLVELVLRGSGLVPDFSVLNFGCCQPIFFPFSLPLYLQEITLFRNTKFFSRWSLPVRVNSNLRETPQALSAVIVVRSGRPAAGARRRGLCARSRWRLPRLRRPLHPRELTMHLAPPPKHLQHGLSSPTQRVLRRQSASSS